jgi:predicted CopG family antitoxin
MARGIDLRDDAYEQLKALKREDESFSDLINRLLDETAPGWRDGFDTLSDDETTELGRLQW